ncbi:ParA family protein [Azospirillum sp.]|uniref:ParA family protein n=1 Tax=Azospirillum sp. TaxID=34012 RepID=UPI002D3D589B|nr:AAA family ATPase [Azospirillum sp.]HYD68552.1 AAA family ATPase [Azospirillum sp.]
MADVMTGEELRRVRETRGMEPVAFVTFLNERLGRKYDRSRLSRWESGGERVPQIVAEVLRAGMADIGAPAGAPARLEHAPAIVVAFANQKGGVGKTQSCVNTAYLAAKAGKRVLVVDCDPQASATRHFGIDPIQCNEQRKTVARVILDDVPTADVILPACDGLLDVLPCGIEMPFEEPVIAGRPNASMLLKAKLAEVADRYDLMLLDLPPNLGVMTVAGLNATNYVVIPSQTEILSVVGISMLFRSIKDVRRTANPNLTVLGILPTLYNARRTLDQEMLKRLEGTAVSAGIKLFAPIKDAAEYPKGMAVQRPALELFPDAPGSEGYRQLADTLVSLSNAAQEARHG